MKKNSDGAYVDDPIHGWFGLTYANYFVAPRMMLQAMPIEWQEKFIALMNEANDIGLEAPGYIVLREDPSYTSVTKDDPDDEGSIEREYYKLQSDPWADYRHPDYSLLPEALQPDFYKEKERG